MNKKEFDSELKEKMDKCKEEFSLQLKEDSTKVQMDPYDKKISPIRQLILTAPKHLKIAFIHDKTENPKRTRKTEPCPA